MAKNNPRTAPQRAGRMPVTPPGPMNPQQATTRNAPPGNERSANTQFQAPRGNAYTDQSSGMGARGPGGPPTPPSLPSPGMGQFASRALPTPTVPTSRGIGSGVFSNSTPTSNLPGASPLTNPVPGPVTGGLIPSEDIGGGKGGTFAVPGTGSREDTRRAAGQFSSTSQQEIQNLINNILSLQQGALNNQNQTFNAAYGGYKQGQDTGYYDPTILNNLRSLTSELSTTGGFDPVQVANIQNQFGKIGVNLQDTYNIDKGFTGTSGAMDPAALAAITGGYQKFADTGGFTPDQSAAFMRQATSGVPAIYDVLAQQAQRNRAATGGLGTGGDIAQMARQMSQQQSQATTGAEVSLNEQINANKLAGLGGLTGVGENVAGQRLGAAGQMTGVENAATGLGSAESGLASDIASGRRSGAGLETGLESNVASNKAAATAGMAGLFNTSTGEVTQMGQQILDALGIDSSNQQLALRVLASLADAQGAGPMGILAGISNFITAGAKGAGEGAAIAGGGAG